MINSKEVEVSAQVDRTEELAKRKGLRREVGFEGTE
jgi:hypothetical protein